MQRSYRQFQMERALPGLEARVARLEVGCCVGIVVAVMGFAGVRSAGAGGASGQAGGVYCCNRAPAAVLSGVVCTLPGRGSDNPSGELRAGCWCVHALCSNTPTAPLASLKPAAAAAAWHQAVVKCRPIICLNSCAVMLHRRRSGMPSQSARRTQCPLSNAGRKPACIHVCYACHLTHRRRSGMR